MNLTFPFWKLIVRAIPLVVGMFSGAVFFTHDYRVPVIGTIVLATYLLFVRLAGWVES